jgi:hypothetical protein
MIDPYIDGCISALCRYSERDEVPPAIRGDIIAIRAWHDKHHETIRATCNQ